MQDCEINPCFNIRFASGEPMLWRSAEPASGSRLVLETSSRLLFYAFASDWGGDAITPGYGCEIYMFDEDAIRASLDISCLWLLTRHPRRQSPFPTAAATPGSAPAFESNCASLADPRSVEASQRKEQKEHRRCDARMALAFQVRGLPRLRSSFAR